MTLAVSKSSLYCWNALLNSACTAGEAEEQAQANDDGAQNKRRRGQRALSMSGWYVAAL